jgi:hypothetical protein
LPAIELVEKSTALANPYLEHPDKSRGPFCHCREIHGLRLEFENQPNCPNCLTTIAFDFTF